VSRVEIPSGIWKKIEGHLLTDTELTEKQDAEKRGEKLLEVVKEGVQHVQ